MSVVPLRKAVEAVEAGSPDAADHRAAARRRASIVTELPSPEPEGSPAFPAAGHALSRAGEVAATASSRFADLAARPLIHLHPPAVSAVWARHHEAASHWDAALVRVPRLAWGVMHTGVTGVIYGLLWATSSPAGFVVLVVLTVACRIWI